MMLQRLALALRRLLRSVQDLLLPLRCVGCRCAGTSLCPRCLGTITRFASPTCSICDLPHSIASDTCPACRRRLGLSPLAGVRLVGPHEGTLRTAIHALKYQQTPQLAAPLGALLAERWLAAGTPLDGIIPVPLHPTRLQARGYNQAELLAREVAAQTGLRLVSSGLQRMRHTAPQVGQDRAARLQNVAGAFVASPQVAGQHWLLIDDVFTTGATLGTCAETLRRAGAASVWALALARPYTTPVAA